MSAKRFSTFEGVFTPCLLSILGVIMYLRLGWVVGQVGFVGTITIIILANLITLATALSMSSIVTNIRIGAGGAYSIISKSLGIEAGGAIGIPLYLSQAISVAFYVAGFVEVWAMIFPQHDFHVVGVLVWFFLLGISYVSAKFAFRIQYVIMGVIGLSLVAVVAGSYVQTDLNVFWPGTFDVGFWKVFAIFFPAVTGVLAGAAMSGELANPRKSIPQGTIAAIGVSFLIYCFLAFWFASHAQAATLVQDSTFILTLGGQWKWAIIAGMMGATVSSGLAMFVGSPRTLMALGKHGLIPCASQVSHTNSKGEPTTAVLFTSLISLCALLLGSLDTVASLLTMFFLITYGMINLTVFIEDIIGIASFRPTFRVPRIVSFLGFVGCGIVMFIIDPLFSVAAVVIISIVYYFLLRQESVAFSPDVRSGLLTFLAEQMAIASSKLPYHPKIWKPSLLIIHESMQEVAANLRCIESLIVPRGRLVVLHIDRSSEEKIYDNQYSELKETLKPLLDKNVFVEQALIKHQHVDVVPLMQMVKGFYFPPNILFGLLSTQTDQFLSNQIGQADKQGLGVILFQRHHQYGLAKEEIINLWFRRESPNIDLSVLMALQLKNSWDAKLRIIMVVANEEEVKATYQYLRKLQRIMRLPLDMEMEVLVGTFKDALDNVPAADLNIFGMAGQPDFKAMRELSQKVQTSVMFIKDSKFESAIV